jgi:hypothetical protein
VTDKRTNSSVPRASWRAVVLAMLVLGLSVLPVAAVTGPTSLIDPSVSPTVATPTTTITFAVTYRHRQGAPTDYVRVVIGSKAYEMAPTSTSTDYRNGVRYQYKRTLALGTYTVRFEGRGRDKFEMILDAGTVTIRESATPTPKPTPAPTPKPTPTPTPAPTPAPTSQPPGPGATPAPGGTATPAPGGTATPAPGATGSPAPTTPGGSPRPDWYIVEPDDGRWPDDGTTPPADPATEPSPAPTDGVDGGGPGTGAAGGGTGGSGTGTGGSGGPGTGGAGGNPDPGAGFVPNEPDDSGLFGEALSRQLGAAAVVIVRNVPAAAVSTGTVTASLAFLVFGKRRRESEQPAPDDVLAAAAASGTALVPNADVALGRAAPVLDSPDAHLPRWRRPSLLEARKTDPIRNATPTNSARLTFEDSAVPDVPDGERRLIRYRLVRLLDRPDELLGAEIGFLDQGDEVMLLEKHGTYWRVLCPDGSQGWLHKMTLGDMVIDAGAAGAGESWTSGDDGPASPVDEMLRAMTERRQGLQGR